MFRFRTTLASHLREEDVRKFSEDLAELGYTVSIARENVKLEALWALEYFTPDKEDMNSFIAGAEAALKARGWDEIHLHHKYLDVTEIDDDTDWLAESYRAFPPFSVGPFFIYGSHHEGGAPAGQTGLQIDAATAFGSGEHGTTKGCLQAMIDLKEQGACPWNVLDMGTGSGILAIAAHKLWKTPVLAVDNDAEAVRVADHHAALNKIPAGKTDYTGTVGDGFKAMEVQGRKPFDLIIANILAGPLKDMAGDLIAVSDENGYVILSGILQQQADEVIAAYKNLALRKRYDIGEWVTLLLQNSAS